MNRYVVAVTVVLSSFLFGATSGSAQVGIGISAGAGPSFPIGELGEEADTGFNLRASVHLSGLPIELRGDGFFQQFNEAGEAGDPGWIRGLGGIANVIFRLPMVAVSPYVLGGLGLIHTEDEHGHEAPADELAFTAGVGLNVNRVFVEARVLLAGEHHRAIPITLGVRLF